MTLHLQYFKRKNFLYACLGHTFPTWEVCNTVWKSRPKDKWWPHEQPSILPHFFGDAPWFHLEGPASSLSVHEVITLLLTPGIETQPRIGQSAYPSHGPVLQSGPARVSPMLWTITTGVKELSLCKDLERWWDVSLEVPGPTEKKAQLVETVMWTEGRKDREEGNAKKEPALDDTEQMNRMTCEALKTLNIGYSFAKANLHFWLSPVWCALQYHSWFLWHLGNISHSGKNKVLA